MSDALKTDLLREKAKKNLKKAQAVEKRGAVDQAVVYYEKALSILEMLEELEGGKAEEKMRKRIRFHLVRLHGDDIDVDLGDEFSEEDFDKKIGSSSNNLESKNHNFIF